MEVTVNNGIPNVCAIMGQPFSYTIPLDAFSGSNLTYTAAIHHINKDNVIDDNHASFFIDYRNRLNLGLRWLSFSVNTFSGTPNDFLRDYKSLQIIVRATDTTDGQYAEETFYITVHEYAIGITPTPMAKQAVDAAFIIDNTAVNPIDLKALGVQPGQTVMFSEDFNFSWYRIRMNAGIKGNPVYITNPHGTLCHQIASYTGASFVVGKSHHCKMLGQAVSASNPYGLEFSGLKGPAIQSEQIFRYCEFGWIEIYDSGFAGFSCKNTIGVELQRPGVSAGQNGTSDKRVYVTGTTDPSSEAEMNSISATLGDWCVRLDLITDQLVDSHMVYNGSLWAIPDYTLMVPEAGNDLGNVPTYADLSALSPSIGDEVFVEEDDFWYIYNLSSEWEINQNIIRLSLHHLYAHDTGTENGTISPVAGEGIYTGPSFTEPKHILGDKAYPNGAHVIDWAIVEDLITTRTAWESFQFSSMCENTVTSYLYGDTYGIGTYNISIQNEGIQIGCGSGGKYHHIVVKNASYAGSHGIQSYFGRDTTCAFFEFINEGTYLGNVPIFIRRHDYKDGGDPSSMYFKLFFSTFKGYSDTLGITSVISDINNRELYNCNFDDIQGSLAISGITVNLGTVINDAIYETGTHNPIAGACLTNAVDVSSEDWTYIVDRDGNLRDNYGNVVNLTSPSKVGAIQDSPIGALINPIANAGTDQSITLFTSTLNGAGSYDQDGTIVSYLWEQISGPNTANILTPSGISSIVNGMIVGDYVFRLTVTDNDGLTDNDTVTITINPVVSTNKANARVLL